MKNIIVLFFTLAFLNGFAQSDYFWVGGTGNWTETTNWATTSGGTDLHNQVPTSLDNVFFDANSFDATGQTVTLDNNDLMCNNIDFTGVTNSPTFNGNSKTLLVYGSIGLVEAMSINATNFQLEATTTGHTLTTAGHTLGNLTFNGIGGEWTLQDELTSSSTFNLKHGSVITNSYTLNINNFDSENANVRALTLGSSIVNLGTSGQWNVRTTNNFTLNSGTSTINLINGRFYQGESNIDNGWHLTYYNVNFSPTGDNKAQLYTYNGGGRATYNNLTSTKGLERWGGGGEVIVMNDFSCSGPYTGYWGGLIDVGGTATFGDSATFDALFTANTINFNGVGATYLLSASNTMTANTMNITGGNCGAFTTIRSSSAGSQAILSVTSGTIAVDYVNLKDINATGGATFNVNNAIDDGNNSGWSISALVARDLYWIGNDGNWSDGNNWSLSSGGTPVGCAPISLDNVFFDANSFDATGQTVTLDNNDLMCNNIDFTGVTNSPTFNGNSKTLLVYGSIGLVEAMSINATNFQLEATTTGHTLTTAGHTLGNLTFNGIGGEWTLQDELTSSSTFNLKHGSVITNSYTLNINNFDSENANVRALTLGSSIVNLGTSGQWNVRTTNNFTLNSGTSTINLINGRFYQGESNIDNGWHLTYYNVNFSPTGDNKAQLYTYNGGGRATYNNLTSTKGLERWGGGGEVIVMNDFSCSGPYTGYWGGLIDVGGTATFGDSATFDALFTANTINFNGVGATYLLSASNTMTANTMNIAGGSLNAPTFIKSSSNGNIATIDVSSGDVCSDYLRIQEISAIGLATYTAGPNSQDLGNSSGWTFASFSDTASDCNPPVISLLGNALTVVELGATYTDAGATAFDNYDGEITANISSLTTIDTNTIGTYTVTYDVSDANGNAANQVVRTIDVVQSAEGYYWVGGSGNWSDVSHWATTSGGSVNHTSPPTITDNVYFNNYSFSSEDQIVNLDISEPVCKSMDWTGALNSPTFNVNSKKIHIAGSLTLIPEMSWSGNNINLGTTFTSTQASNTITTAGHDLGRLWFDGPGAEWYLTDNVDGYEILITSGVLNTQNFDISLSAGARGIQLYSPSNTHDKGIRLGTSTVTLANGQNVAWDLNGAEVVEASQSTIVITGYRNDCCGNYFRGGGHVYNDLIFTSDKADAGGFWQIEGDNTFNTVTFTTDGKLTGSNTINTLNLAQGSTHTFSSGQTQTIGTITGSGDCISGTTWKSSSTSSQTNISIASGTFDLDYFTIQGLNITGGATVNMTNVVDQGNNTGVNIISTVEATNKNLYWVGGSGNWANGNNWSETSGGTAYGCKPNATDNVYFDANSFDASGQTVTVDITGDLCKSMDWTGALNSPTFNVNSKKIHIAGSLTLIPEMSWSGNNINLGTTFTSTQASNTITTAGHDLGRLWFDGPGAEWYLTDNVDGYEILITSGVLNTQNFDISLSAGARGIQLYSPSNTHDKGIRLGTSTVTLANGQNVAWDLNGAEVVEASQSTIVITGYRNDCCGNYFRGGGHVYNDLIFTSDKADAGGFWQIEGDNTFNTVTFTTDGKLTGSNTINTLNLAKGSIYTFTEGQTQTILSAMTSDSEINFPVTIKSSSSSQSLIDIPTASVCLDYMTIENIHVVDYGYFDAGANSTNQGSNEGILFDGLCTFDPKPMLGSGTEIDPFQIANFDHLLWLSENGGSSQHFLQTADIDASTSSTLNSGLGFSPIAFNASVYNGAGYKISNLFMDRPDSNSGGHTAGVFGLVDNGSVIKNVSIVDADITGYQLVGVIVGELKGDSYLLTSYATGLLESDGRQTGALVGNMRGGTVKNCYSNVYMTRFGSSYTMGTITGNNYGNDLIENCYSIGGGTPIIAISHYTGGDAAIKNSFYLDVHTYIGSNWCNNCVESGETSKSETEMKTVSTYIASGWDFVGESNNGTDDVWVEDIDGSVNNGYPYLAIQKGTPAFTETYVDVNPIDDILVNSNAPKVVNISSINNSGGDTVFSATSSDETVATVSISNLSTIGNETTADLTITNVGEGNSQIYIYGSNPNNRDGGASFFVYEADYTAPTAALTFKVGSDVVSSMSVTEVLLITADFSEPLNDSPVVQIGSNAFSAQNMTKVSDTKYTYEWDAPDNIASGDITFTLSTGTDLSGNVVASVPISGTSIFLELAPELPSGSGSEEDPYLISSFANLLWLSENGGSSQHFLQTADIDASTSSTLNSGLGFSPIAFNASVYNGAGYKISNLFMDRPDSNSGGHTAGVFGLVDNGSVIKNVSIVDADITGYQLVGVIVGELKGDSYLLTSYATGLLESDGRQTGALVGNMRGGTVKNCYSNVYMTRFGSSYTMGTITGNNYGNDLIENCYSIGGGTPIIAISHYTGGDAAIKNSFYLDVHTYIGSNWCNNCVESGETSKSETEMKTVSTYIASGWDFVGENTNGTDDVWMIDENGIINNGFPYFNPDIYVQDNTAPVITLTGDATVTLEVGTSYIDEGATASDDTDGDITANIVTDASIVDTNIVGTYIITFNVSDAAGNAAVEVTRTVSVVDTTIPVITRLGDDPVSIEVGETYVDAGATASDNYDGNLTTSISVANTVNTAVVGEYTVTYSVSDAAGNAAVEVTRTVSVVDTTIPVITRLGDDPVSIEVGETYVDAGATASDNYDGNLTTSISVANTVNTSIVGEYTVTYSVSDAAGNAAVEVTRTVSVVDTTIPVITRLGDDPVSIEVGETYVDAGATASDNYDGNLTTSISVANTVNTAVVGEYTVTYSVSDAAGNAAVEVTRTVNVVETLGLNSSELNKVSIYPNPTASKWTIESSRIIKTLTLFNLLGQKILEETSNERKVTIDASDLQTGIYMLKINNTTIKKVIKK